MSAIRNMIIRSTSHPVVQDGLAPATEAANGSDFPCWSNMPQELLREVLIRIEASESSWPPRKSVVACAGVCRTWRHITKDLVKVPELSGMLTFPISAKQIDSSTISSKCYQLDIDWGVGTTFSLIRQFHNCCEVTYTGNCSQSSMQGALYGPLRASVVQPGPRDLLLQCFIKRCRSTQTYYLYLSLTSALTDDGKFLLAARKCRRPTCTDYIISLDAGDMSKGSSSYVGKLRSNFLGTKFTVYDGQPPHAGAKMEKSRSSRLVNLKQVSPRVPAGNYPVAHISYELNVLGSRGPRRMHCAMDAIPATAIEPGGVTPTQFEFSHHSLDSLQPPPFLSLKSNCAENFLSGPLSSQNQGVLILKNKSPRWHEQLQCWCLNFHGRVTVASVKNFQLVASPENGPAGPQHEKVILQFGKVGKDLFTMDYRYPISAFQAFAICLSSFDTKIACE